MRPSGRRLMTKGDQRTMSVIKNNDRRQDETGLEVSEYAMAAAMVALVIIIAFTNVGVAIANKISELKSSIIND
jgi:Flp pilus assembly pilin Flp